MSEVSRRGLLGMFAGVAATGLMAKSALAQDQSSSTADHLPPSEPEAEATTLPEAPESESMPPASVKDKDTFEKFGIGIVPPMTGIYREGGDNETIVAIRSPQDDIFIAHIRENLYNNKIIIQLECRNIPDTAEKILDTSTTIRSQHYFADGYVDLNTGHILIDTDSLNPAARTDEGKARFTPLFKAAYEEYARFIKSGEPYPAKEIAYFFDHNENVYTVPNDLGTTSMVLTLKNGDIIPFGVPQGYTETHIDEKTHKPVWKNDIRFFNARMTVAGETRITAGAHAPVTHFTATVLRSPTFGLDMNMDFGHNGPLVQNVIEEGQLVTDSFRLEYYRKLIGPFVEPTFEAYLGGPQIAPGLESSAANFVSLPIDYYDGGYDPKLRARIWAKRLAHQPQRGNRRPTHQDHSVRP